jgi:hypothetical protein
MKKLQTILNTKLIDSYFLMKRAFLTPKLQIFATILFFSAFPFVAYGATVDAKAGANEILSFVQVALVLVCGFKIVQSLVKGGGLKSLGWLVLGAFGFYLTGSYDTLKNTMDAIANSGFGKFFSGK